MGDAPNTVFAALREKPGLVAGPRPTVIAPSANERSEHNANLICALMERNCAAIRDWDALSTS